jgi:uncharacterized protein RhaS with RHS repeats
MQARYYDPVIGRFYSNDPVGFKGIHSFNRYAYANNNPYRYVDPDGREGVDVRLNITMNSIANGSTSLSSYKASLPTSGAIVDFVPVFGDIKGFTDFAADPSFVSGAAAVVGLVPGLGDAAAKAIKVFSKEKQALVDMAKMDKKGDSVTQGDMDAYSDLNAELPDSFPANKVRGLESHPNRPHGKEPHGHVAPVNHIPEKKVDE